MKTPPRLKVIGEELGRAGWPEVGVPAMLMPKGAGIVFVAALAVALQVTERQPPGRHSSADAIQQRGPS